MQRRRRDRGRPEERVRAVRWGEDAQVEHPPERVHAQPSHRDMHGRIPAIRVDERQEQERQAQRVQRARLRRGQKGDAGENFGIPQR